ncbi:MULTISPECIES: ferredoxin--NADP reductase [unclassified Rhodococcus (in: high G+C Gram-positive bacteria)]|uniref:ferredoxin--NADP reductase n=1 Tax=unclassified Rhodococcus (in: high G+C Gram-positive bacteria) TaxID=192944 RepID=UPI0024B66AFA|nr:MULTISPECIES: ferredoxin--NADP reductase [unclassified Rhodococcus (in: high G+C Gram-positive bacteria)]MDI9927159.1 ferredoxin--NADP reductase [Rhodococcus sp. IEGM 1341]MDV8056313.1 ferredoxin--NADP reductase [Rhodococcus sp. IEGM 1343]
MFRSAPPANLGTSTSDPEAGIFELEITEVTHETEDAVSLGFAVPEHAETHFRYAPGQFLTLEIPCTDGGSVARCYSFSSSPVRDPFPTVTVKRIQDGLASHWLHDNAVRGMRLKALKPSGMFGPENWGVDFVLLAAGSGITPIMSIIKTALLRHENRITLVYANQNRDSVIFAEQLTELQSRFPDRLDVHHWYASDSGLPTAAGLATMNAAVPAECEAFLCGPPQYMNVAEEWLARTGTVTHRTHREVFSSFDSNPFRSENTASAHESDAQSVTAQVEIDGTETEFAWNSGTKLLDRLLELGLDPPYVCREGTCGGCAYTLTEGTVTMLANETLDEHELEHGVRLACQSVPESQSIRAVFDR